PSSQPSPQPSPPSHPSLQPSPQPSPPSNPSSQPSPQPPNPLSQPSPQSSPPSHPSFQALNPSLQASHPSAPLQHSPVSHSCQSVPPKPVTWAARSDVLTEAANIHHAPSQALQALQRSHSSQLLQHSHASSQPSPPLQRSPVSQSLQTPQTSHLQPYPYPTSQPQPQPQQHIVFDTHLVGPPAVSVDNSGLSLDNFGSHPPSLPMAQNGLFQTSRVAEYGHASSRTSAGGTDTVTNSSVVNTGLPVVPGHDPVPSNSPMHETRRGVSRRNKTTTARLESSDINQVRKSSRIKRKNPEPVSQPQPQPHAVAKKQKQKQYYSNIVTQSDGRVALVQGEEVVGYINKDVEG
ncbi:hypothetical protein F5878DRAFT_680841, partial [Lentinula raphanica]